MAPGKGMGVFFTGHLPDLSWLASFRISESYRAVSMGLRVVSENFSGLTFFPIENPWLKTRKAKERKKANFIFFKIQDVLKSKTYEVLELRKSLQMNILVTSTAHHSPFTIHNSQFTIHHSPLTIHPSLPHALPLHRMTYRYIHQPLGKGPGIFVKRINGFMDLILIAAA